MLNNERDEEMKFEDELSHQNPQNKLIFKDDHTFNDVDMNNQNSSDEDEWEDIENVDPNVE